MLCVRPSLQGGDNFTGGPTFGWHSRRLQVVRRALSPEIAASLVRREPRLLFLGQLQRCTETLVVGGARIKAVNNKDCIFTRALRATFIRRADARPDDYLQRLNQSDTEESGTERARVKNLAEKIAAIRERRMRCTEMLAALEQSGESRISLTDPSSRAIAAHTMSALATTCRSRSTPGTS